MIEGRFDAKTIIMVRVTLIQQCAVSNTMVQFNPCLLCPREMHVPSDTLHSYTRMGQVAQQLVIKLAGVWILLK
jgi:hypothetical protein